MTDYDSTEAKLSSAMLRLEQAIRAEVRTDDCGVGIRTGLRLAMEIVEGVQQDYRTEHVRWPGGFDEPDYA